MLDAVRPRCVGTARRRGRAGFTIVESLLAGVVLAIFASALSSTIAQSSRSAWRAQDQRQAAEWLDLVLTRIDLIGPNRLATQGPVSGALDDRFSWTATFVQDAVLLDLYRVSVVVDYTAMDGRPARVVGYTQLHDPPGLRRLAVGWEDL